MSDLSQPGDQPRQPSSPETRKRAFKLLFFSLTCLGMGQSLMFANLPPIARELGFSEFHVGAIFMVSAIFWVFCSPMLGRRSDIWGRRPVILVGLIAYAVSTAAFGFIIQMALWGWLSVVPAVVLLVLARILYGALGAGTIAAGQAYVADRTSRAERVRAVAGMNAGFSLGVTIGPGVGAALVVFGLLMPFYGIALLALASAVSLYLMLPEQTPPKGQAMRPRLSPFDRRVLPFLLASIMITTVQALTIQTAAFYFMDVLGLAAAETVQYVGVGLMASAMAAVLAQLAIIPRLNPSAQFLMRIGCVIGIAAYVMFLLADSYGPLVFALVISGLAFGLARPGIAAAASLSVRQDEQGSVAGLVGATGAAGHVISPIFAMPLYKIDPSLPYLAGVILFALFGLMVMLNGTIRRAGRSLAEEGQGGPDSPSSL